MLWSACFNMILTVCVIIHSQPHVDVAFPHLWAIFNDKFILFRTVDGQKFYKKINIKNKQTLKIDLRHTMFFLAFKKYQYLKHKCDITEASADCFSAVESVAFDRFLLSVDKVVTFGSKCDPGTSVCWAIYEKNVIFIQHTDSFSVCFLDNHYWRSMSTKHISYKRIPVFSNVSKIILLPARSAMQMTLYISHCFE